jgi:hypothetical protein
VKDRRCSGQRAGGAAIIGGVPIRESGLTAMKFDEYQKGGNELYKRLAKVVRQILEAAA